MKVAVEKELVVAGFLSTLIINNNTDLDQMLEYAEHLAGMLRFLMDQYSHKQKDLMDVASRTVISEILNGRRELTKTHRRGERIAAC